MWKNPKFWSQIISFAIKKPYYLWDLTYFNKLKFSGNFRSCFKNWIDRFVAMVIKDLQTEFGQVMFNSLVSRGKEILKWRLVFSQS